MKDWTEFGIRHGPVMSARSRVGHVPALAHLLDPTLAAFEQAVAAPLTGITTDGLVRGTARTLQPSGVATDAITDAARAFLDALDPHTRAQATFPVDSREWRTWFNVHMNFYRHGISLEDLTDAQRDGFVALLRATLSERGFRQARDIMVLNELLGEITGSADEFGEWPYFVSFFGSPSAEEPWGWQIDGHHLAVNAVVLGDQLVVTPTFMGSEPCSARNGRYAGIEVLALEQHTGLALMRALDPAQQTAATQYASIMPDALPRHLQHFIDGRMQAGASKDNAVLPYEGVCSDAFSAGQRALLRAVIGTYVSWQHDGHAALRMHDVDAHLDRTWFSWMGGTGPEDAFYYRIHNPVVLIEFDHHPGVALDNREPTHHHIHSIIRTPNGGDYGADLLAQHYARHHTHGGGAHAGSAGVHP